MNVNLHKKLCSLPEISKSQLSAIFSKYSGSKDLILEPCIIKPLERICGVKWLRGNMIQKIYKLEDTVPVFQSTYQFYIIYTDFEAFKKILQQVKPDSKNKIHVIIVPRILASMDDYLESVGLYHPIVELHSYQWMPIQIDKGILSLEMPYFYKRLYIRQDLSFLPVCAKAMWHMAFVTGRPKFSLAVGSNSNAILKQWDIYCEKKGQSDRKESDFAAVVLIDRSLDYASALLTPTTYSALLNEVYGVQSGICEYKEKIDGEYDGKSNVIVKKEQVKFELNSARDGVYCDIRNRYFTEVTSTLSSLTKQLRSERDNSKGMDLQEIKDYVAKQLQAASHKKKCLSNHLLAAETIVRVLGNRFESHHDTETQILQNKNRNGNVSYLEEILVTENDKFVALRLFCLIAITQKFTEQEIASFMSKFLNEFGFNYGFLQGNLLKTGFLPQEQVVLPNLITKLPKLLSNNFYSNANRLKQIPIDPKKVNLKNPTCCSYVFGGNYIPLVVQIISMLLKNTSLDEIRNKLEPLGAVNIKNERAYPLTSKTFLLYIVGGITYAEIAACNLLETLTGSTIIMCSDRIISGNDIASDLLHLS